MEMNSSGRQTSRSPQESSLVINIQHPLCPSRKYTNMQPEIATVRLKQRDRLLSRQQEIPALCHSALSSRSNIFLLLLLRFGYSKVVGFFFLVFFSRVNRAAC